MVAAVVPGGVFGAAVHHAVGVGVLAAGLVMQFGLSAMHALQAEAQLFDEGNVIGFFGMAIPKKREQGKLVV